jgi:hypothetical protein
MSDTVRKEVADVDATGDVDVSGFHPVDPAAAWRARPVPAKQRAMIEQMGGEIPDGLTAGEASDLSSAAFARRTRPVGD